MLEIFEHMTRHEERVLEWMLGNADAPFQVSGRHPLMWLTLVKNHTLHARPLYECEVSYSW